MPLKVPLKVPLTVPVKVPIDDATTWGPVRGTAPGKLILFGEHAVVYGHRAIAAALDRRTTIDLRPIAGATRILSADISDARLTAALHQILPPQGVGVDIHSELPVGRGLGSSAALAIALIRADAQRQGRTADLAECMDRGFAVERIFHGTPSGLDHTVSARGDAVSYRLTDQGPQVQAAQIAPLSLVVLDSGRAGNTQDLVAGVRARRPAVDPVLCQIGELVDTMLSALACDDLSTVSVGMNANHRLLVELGVSTPELDELVSFARQQGASGAKLAGAGGGGVIIALHPRPADLVKAAASRGISAFATRIFSRQGL